MRAWGRQAGMVTSSSEREGSADGSGRRCARAAAAMVGLGGIVWCRPPMQARRMETRAWVVESWAACSCCSALASAASKTASRWCSWARCCSMAVLTVETVVCSLLRASCAAVTSFDITVSKSSTRGNRSVSLYETESIAMINRDGDCFARASRPSDTEWGVPLCSKMVLHNSIAPRRVCLLNTVAARHNQCYPRWINYFSEERLSQTNLRGCQCVSSQNRGGLLGLLGGNVNRSFLAGCSVVGCLVSSCVRSKGLLRPPGCTVSPQ